MVSLYYYEVKYMKNVRSDRQKQINDIVSVVKLSSLLFIGIILCKEFIKNDSLIIVAILKYTINMHFYLCH